MSIGVFAGAAIGTAAPLAAFLPSATAGERALNVGVDYVAQVAGNKISGKSWSESWKDINATSLGVSFLNPGGSWSKLIANNSLSSAFSVSTQSGYNGLGGGKSIETAGLQAGLGALTGRLTWGVDRAVGKLKLRINHIEREGISAPGLSDALQSAIRNYNYNGVGIGVVSGGANNAISNEMEKKDK